MKAKSTMGHSPLRAAQWLAAALVLSACGGGNNDGSASASGTANALRIHGQTFNPVPCAVEGGACSLVGQQNVAYGVDGKFVTRSFVSRAPCTDTAREGAPRAADPRPSPGCVGAGPGAGSLVR